MSSRSNADTGNDHRPFADARDGGRVLSQEKLAQGNGAVHAQARVLKRLAALPSIQAFSSHDHSVGTTELAGMDLSFYKAKNLDWRYRKDCFPPD